MLEPEIPMGIKSTTLAPGLKQTRSNQLVS